MRTQQCFSFWTVFSTTNTVDTSNQLSLNVEDGIAPNVYDDNSFSSSEFDKVDDLEYYKETVRSKVYSKKYIDSSLKFIHFVFF